MTVRSAGRAPGDWGVAGAGGLASGAVGRGASVCGAGGAAVVVVVVVVVVAGDRVLGVVTAGPRVWPDVCPDVFAEVEGGAACRDEGAGCVPERALDFGAVPGGAAGTAVALKRGRGGAWPWPKPEVIAAKDSAAMQKGRSTAFM